MNYFDRETKNEKIIEEHLRNYESSLDSLVIKLSHEKKEDCIRLHESTLGKEELIAFNKAYLEGNNNGKYTERYESAAARDSTQNIAQHQIRFFDNLQALRHSYKQST